jgi:hypothetical protein
MPERRTVNIEYYLQVPKYLLARIKYETRPEHFGCWLLHDNAPDYSTIDVRAFLAKKKGTPVLNHPPYSTNLAPADLCLFLKLKMRLEVRRFDTVNNVKKNVMVELNTITTDDLSEFFKAHMNAEIPHGLFYGNK